MLLEEIQLTNLLSGSQKKALLSAINESLAINDELLELTDSIYSKFNDEFSKKQFKYIRGEEHDIRFKAIEVDAEFRNERIKVRFKCFNLLNNYTAEYYEDKYKLGNAETTVERMEVNINVELFFGTLKTNVKSLLQHELEHLFQNSLGKRLNSHSLGQKGRDAYNKAYKILNSNTQDARLFRVSYVIYTLSESEIDAFVNQLYQELTSAGFGNAIQTLKNSNTYNYYLNSRKILKSIKDNRGYYEDVISSFGLEYEKFIKVFTKLSKRYISKIGKVLARYNEENQPTEILFNNLDKQLDKYNPEK